MSKIEYMKKGGFYAVILVVVWVLGGGCSGAGDVALGGDVVWGEVGVAVSFRVGDQRVSGGGVGDLGSRSIVDPGVSTNEGTHPGYVPRDVWVMQYDGVGDDARLSGVPRYVEISGAMEIQAVASVVGNTLIFVANTHDATMEWGDVSTLGKIQQVCKAIQAERDCLGNNFSSYNDLIMSGKYQGPITGGAISVELFRNIVRLDFMLSNGAASGMTITWVQLCNVPSDSYYTAALIPRDMLWPPVFNYFHYPRESAYEAENPGGGHLFTFYMPVNQQGTVSAATDSKLKSLHAPGYSTHLRIDALDAQGRGYTYKIYPGANMINDYNLSANNRYSVQLTLNSKGDITTDGRIQGYDQVDFESANSYILNPSPVGAAARVFTIPIGRLNDFWKVPDPALMIGLGDAWTAEILWQDVPEPEFIRFVDPANGGLPTTTMQGTGPDQRITLTAKSGSAGNALIGIKKVGHEGVGYLWSWHLWVTDYNPDRRVAPQDGVYCYAVQGGAVHRYRGYLWEGPDAPYLNKYTMDRSFGARHAGYSSTGAIFYQFGRKDPMPGTYGNTFYDATGTPLSSADPMNPGTNNPPMPQGVTLATGVLNPTAWYCMSQTGNWTNEGTSTGYPWNDPQPGLDRKSIFDPCPPGWKLPINGTISDFRYVAADPSLCTIAHPERDPRLAWNYNGIIGLRYWPLGQTVAGDIFYPAHGYRDYGDGSITRIGTNSYHWSSAPEGLNAAVSILCTPLSAGVSREGRAFGFQARCVQQ